jgi:hypothetical protein
MVAAVALSGVMLAGAWSAATADGMSDAVRAAATAAAAEYGAQKAAVLSCLAHEPGGGDRMRKIYGDDETDVRASWLARGGTSETWSKFETSFGESADVPRDRCPEILKDLYAMRSPAQLLSMRAPFKTMK